MDTVVESRLSFASVSDAKYVANIRRYVAFHQRWRRWFVALYSGGALVVLGLSIFAANAVAGFGQMANAQNIALIGFGVGALVGSMLGGLVMKTAHGLVVSLSTSRTERLLLRYHDAIEMLAHQAGEGVDTGGSAA
jgi:hypothetical protein